ncbi:MAG: hypothetical protein ACTMH0_02045, partial [Brevibacterium linens]
DSDCAGALGGSDRAEKLDDEARVVPPRADSEFSVMIPWRYVRRTSQPATIDIGGSSVGIDIVDADERPMSPTEELLRAAILEHRRRL